MEGGSSTLRTGVGQVYTSNSNVHSCVVLEASLPPLALAQFGLGCQAGVGGHLAERLGLLELEGDLRSIEDMCKSSSALRRYSKIDFRSGIYSC